MKPYTPFALCSMVMLMMSAPLSAGVITFNVTLSGLQSVPNNASTASGSATVVVDDVANTVFVSLTFSNLTGGAASAAHIHCCAATNANGPVVIPFTGFPSATSGTYTNLFTGVSAANIAGIEAGLAYINIHNTVFPGGEIRGDITPEPASLSFAGLGVAMLAGARALRNRWESR